MQLFMQLADTFWCRSLDRLNRLLQQDSRGFLVGRRIRIGVEGQDAASGSSQSCGGSPFMLQHFIRVARAKRVEAVDELFQRVNVVFRQLVQVIARFFNSAFLFIGRRGFKRGRSSVLPAAATESKQRAKA